MSSDAIAKWSGYGSAASLGHAESLASRDDIEVTREIKAAAEALGIAIHDHLVIGRKGHASFRSLGLL